MCLDAGLNILSSAQRKKRIRKVVICFQISPSSPEIAKNPLLLLSNPLPPPRPPPFLVPILFTAIVNLRFVHNETPESEKQIQLKARPPPPFNRKKKNLRVQKEMGGGVEESKERQKGKRGEGGGAKARQNISGRAKYFN